MNTRSRRNSERILKEAAFVIFTAVLVLVAAFFVTGTVVSQSRGSICVDEAYYQVLEEEYVREIRSCLAEQGYRNSGVTLTKTVEADGERNYEVQLHHKKLYKLTEEEQCELFSELKKLAFEVAGCNFQVNLLM